MEEIDRALSMTNPHSMGEDVSYMIWGAVATTTRAFGNVRLKVSAVNCMVFVEITLRWWARFEKLEKLRELWLKTAENRARRVLPTGWRLVVHYGKRKRSDEREGD